MVNASVVEREVGSGQDNRFGRVDNGVATWEMKLGLRNPAGWKRRKGLECACGRVDDGNWG